MRLLIAEMLILLVFGATLFAPTTAKAHHQRNNLDTSGIPIPNLTHGQLSVMARYQSSILDLAEKEISPDLQDRTLQNFINLQYAYCLWGMIPGSLSNENSAFNECSHSYLAGTKALLDHLQRTGDYRAEAATLARNINIAMLLDSSALQMCRNSLQPFNTAQIVMPEWWGVAVNPLALLLLIFILMAMAALVVMNRRAGKIRSNSRQLHFSAS